MFGKITPFPNFFLQLSLRLLVFQTAWHAQNMSYVHPGMQGHRMVPWVVRMHMATGHEIPTNVSRVPFLNQTTWGIHLRKCFEVCSNRSRCVTLLTEGIEKRPDGSFLGQHHNMHSSGWHFRAGVRVLAPLWILSFLIYEIGVVKRLSSWHYYEDTN